MMSDFCQEMRTVDTRLCDLIARKSSWQHYWTGYIPDSSSRGGSSFDSIPLGVGRPDNEDVDRQLKEAVSLARQTQSQLDRERAANRASTPDSSQQKLGGKADKGDGKGRRRARGGGARKRPGGQQGGNPQRKVKAS